MSMWRMHRYMAPQNAHIAEVIRFCPLMKGLKVVWTANAAMSEGTEQFVDEYLPIIQRNNSNAEFHLHRTYVDCDPFIIAILDYQRTRKQRLSWKHPCQILAIVQQWSIGGDYRPGRKRGMQTIAPRGRLIWDTETKGHDVFQVFSKYKADPPDPNALTTATHPSLYIKRMWGKTISPLMKEKSQSHSDSDGSGSR